MTNTDLIDKVRKHFLELFQKKHSGYQFLDRHVQEVERWALKILEKHPNANKDVVMIGVWLHDVGQLIGDTSVDHAINSETETKQYLQELHIDQNIIDQVAHCVRAHRNRDIKPETLEAKIVAASDSASHMTDINYIVHLSDGMRDYVDGKIERDYRDISVFPELKEEITPLYQAWKALIQAFPASDKKPEVNFA